MKLYLTQIINFSFPFPSMCQKMMLIKSKSSSLGSHHIPLFNQGSTDRLLANYLERVCFKQGYYKGYPLQLIFQPLSAQIQTRLGLRGVQAFTSSGKPVIDHFGVFLQSRLSLITDFPKPKRPLGDMKKILKMLSN